jgi:hypothetical protein
MPASARRVLPGATGGVSLKGAAARRIGVVPPRGQPPRSVPAHDDGERHLRDGALLASRSGLPCRHVGVRASPKSCLGSRAWLALRWWRANRTPRLRDVGPVASCCFGSLVRLRHFHALLRFGAMPLSRRFRAARDPRVLSRSLRDGTRRRGAQIRLLTSRSGLSRQSCKGPVRQAERS